MKKLFFNQGISLVVLFTILNIFGCQEDVSEVASVKSTELEDRGNPNSKVFPVSSRPFGKTFAMWSQEWWKYVMRFPCDKNPLLDETGKLAANEQSGPVFFLVGSSGSSVERSVVVPSGKGIFFPVINYINDYPCPDPNFKPEPGQSLQDFLKAGALGVINMVDGMEVSIDGQKLNRLSDYRITTNLFSFVGNPDLSTCIDACVTGYRQDAVSDGYWIMLKPLSKGKHTLHFHGEIPAYGFVLDVKYLISVL